MPALLVTVVNETFESRNQHEAATATDAYQQAIRGALEIGVEVSKGKPFFGAEVRVENHDSLVSRFVVSVGASPLQSPQYELGMKG